MVCRVIRAWNAFSAFRENCSRSASLVARRRIAAAVPLNLSPAPAENEKEILSEASSKEDRLDQPLDR
jgi:hypothetical protein